MEQFSETIELYLPWTVSEYRHESEYGTLLRQSWDIKDTKGRIVLSDLSRPLATLLCERINENRSKPETITYSVPTGEISEKKRKKAGRPRKIVI